MMKGNWVSLTQVYEIKQPWTGQIESIRKLLTPKGSFQRKSKERVNVEHTLMSIGGGVLLGLVVIKTQLD